MKVNKDFNVLKENAAIIDSYTTQFFNGGLNGDDTRFLKQLGLADINTELTRLSDDLLYGADGARLKSADHKHYTLVFLALSDLEILQLRDSLKELQSIDRETQAHAYIRYMSSIEGSDLTSPICWNAFIKVYSHLLSLNSYSADNNESKKIGRLSDLFDSCTDLIKANSADFDKMMLLRDMLVSSVSMPATVGIHSQLEHKSITESFAKEVIGQIDLIAKECRVPAAFLWESLPDGVAFHQIAIRVMVSAHVKSGEIEKYTPEFRVKVFNWVKESDSCPISGDKMVNVFHALYPNPNDFFGKVPIATIMPSSLAKYIELQDIESLSNEGWNTAIKDRLFTFITEGKKLNVAIPALIRLIGVSETWGLLRTDLKQAALDFFPSDLRQSIPAKIRQSILVFIDGIGDSDREYARKVANIYSHIDDYIQDCIELKIEIKRERVLFAALKLEPLRQQLANMKTYSAQSRKMVSDLKKVIKEPLGYEELVAILSNLSISLPPSVQQYVELPSSLGEESTWAGIFSFSLFKKNTSPNYCPNIVLHGFSGRKSIEDKIISELTTKKHIESSQVAVKEVVTIPKSIIKGQSAKKAKSHHKKSVRFAKVYHPVVNQDRVPDILMYMIPKEKILDESAEMIKFIDTNIKALKAQSSCKDTAVCIVYESSNKVSTIESLKESAGMLVGRVYQEANGNIRGCHALGKDIENYVLKQQGINTGRRAATQRR